MITRLTLCLALLALAPVPARAQAAPSGWNPSSLKLAREDLLELERRYQAVLDSPAYGDRLKERARRELSRIRVRLDEGDFRPGDRIALSVEGEQVLQDTLVVDQGPAVTLPLIGRIGLTGVLRSELEPYMTRQIGRYLQDPVVEASSLIRVSFQGGVNRPGFYVLPADALLTDAVMAAGGPAPRAELGEIRVLRGDEVVVEGEATQRAISEGLSLDQLSVRAGDRVVVPLSEGAPAWVSLVRYGMIIASTLLLGVRVF